MTREDHIKYWIATAEHDYDAMEGIYNAGKYDWALFVGHGFGENFKGTLGKE